MSVVKGLKNINALLDKPKYDSDKPRMRWLKLADGQSVKIRLLKSWTKSLPTMTESADCLWS